MENAVSGICFNSGNELFLALCSARNISIAATFLKGVSETAFLNRSFLIRPPEWSPTWVQLRLTMLAGALAAAAHIAAAALEAHPTPFK